MYIGKKYDQADFCSYGYAVKLDDFQKNAHENLKPENDLLDNSTRQLIHFPDHSYLIIVEWTLIYCIRC